MNTKQLLGIVLIVGVGAFALMAYSTMQSKKEAQELRTQIEELQKGSPAASEAEVQAIISEVGRLISLPGEETPTLATVSDRDKLKEIPFFANAETGDKVLIYVKARKAYLYRPSQQKLVEVAAINLAPDARVNEEFSESIFLRNGSGTAGLSRLVEDDLKKVLPNAKIIGRDNAVGSFDKTTVVALSADNKSQAELVAKLFAANVSDLPAGEEKPAGATGVLIIIGKDVAVRAASASPSASPVASPAPTP